MTSLYSDLKDDPITPENAPMPVGRWSSENWAHLFKAFRLGYLEAGGDSGLTWDQDEGLNRAYDKGRALGQFLIGKG